MLCFEITINGEKMCTAGLKEHGVITAVFCQVKAPPQPNTPQTECRELAEPYLSVIGAVNDAHVSWLNGILEIGDEVIVRIIESDKADVPVKAQQEDPEEQKRRRREFYEQCKREFENE